jgi:hypothetical protein
MEREPTKPTVISKEDWRELKELSRRTSELLGKLTQSMEDMERRSNFDIQSALSIYSQANKLMSSLKDRWEDQKCSIIQNFKG